MPMETQRTVRPTRATDPWQEAMRRGDFAAAWEISDRVLAERAGQRCDHWPRHLQFIWDGTPVDGKRVLVRCYHGLGDTVMMMRFLPLLQARAREVILWAQPDLLPLLRTAPGVDRLLPLHDGTPECAYDVDVESMELPHVLRIEMPLLPARVPYLGRPRPVRPISRERAEWDVGVVWQAGDWDPGRSLPVTALAPLAELPGVRLHALQQGPARTTWPLAWGPLSGAREVEAFAAILQRLDVVITVDSFPAHLAGALGVPTWLLLSADPDWRWMNGREDSPWYPTLRLFRQSTLGDWCEVIARVRAELEGFERGS